MTDKKSTVKSDLNTADILQYSHTDVSIYSTTREYQGFFAIDKYTLKHQLFCGKQSETFTREIFERGDAVVVIPYDKVTDTVLLIEQFRVGAIKNNDTPWLLEFIAGMFDANESPIDVAIRETKEEANLSINEDDLLPVMQYLSSPGGMTERIHLYLAHIDISEVNNNETYGLPEENEDIKLHTLGREQAMALLTQGKITNAATVIGLQWLALNYLSL